MCGGQSQCYKNSKELVEIKVIKELSDYLDQVCVELNMPKEKVATIVLFEGLKNWLKDDKIISINTS